MATASEKTQSWIRTLWGPALALIAIVGMFYGLQNQISMNSQAIKAHIELNNQQFGELRKDLIRIDSQGTQATGPYITSIKSLETKIEYLTKQNEQMQTSINDIMRYLRAPTTGP